MIPPRTLPPFAIHTLEFDEVRDRLARFTSFSAGRELALALEPTPDLDEALRWQAETTETQRLPGLRPALHMGGVHDVRAPARRAAIGGVLRPNELLDVQSTVRASRAWRRGLAPLEDELPTLREIALSSLADHSGLAESIEAAIGEAGEVLDSASPALRRIRGELRGAHDRLVTRLREIMSQLPFKDVVQDPVVTERAGRYVIPIRAEARSQVPAIVHDQSASGATVFVEPLAAVDMANRWRTLQVEEEHEVERVLAGLSHDVGLEADALEGSVEGLARLDLALAKARLATEQRATAPTLVGTPRPSGEPVLRLLNARHPLLRGEVVPISLELGSNFDVLLITGPNTGGKTVSLKTAGLLTIMAQSGLHIPADEGSLVAVFARVQADIGDEQSLQQSLSTFSSHITRIVGLLDQADSCSLVLLDELGAGTDPQEGAALARAILDYLRDRSAYVVATTHYSELKAYAHLTSRVQNASVAFDVETLSPTYRLEIGAPGRSQALAIAERLHVPAEVLEAARANLAPETQEVEALLAEIAHERQEAERARERIDLDRAGAQRMMRQARAALRAAEARQREVWNRVEAEANEELAALRREALRLRQQLHEARATPGAPSAGRDAVEAALQLRAPRRPPEAPTPEVPAEPAEQALVAPGAEVLVPKLGLPGRVLSVRDGTAELEVLGRRVRMPVADLAGATRPTAAQRREAQRQDDSLRQRIAIASSRGNVPLTLDLRGLRRDEAIERLDQYVEDASLAGLPSARIIHGKGTGAVRQAVRETLRSNRYVDRFEPEPDAAGGDGATVVWFAEG